MYGIHHHGPMCGPAPVHVGPHCGGPMGPMCGPSIFGPRHHHHHHHGPGFHHMHAESHAAKTIVGGGLGATVGGLVFGIPGALIGGALGSLLGNASCRWC